MNDDCEHLVETLEAVAERLDYLLASEWSKDFLREKLKEMKADLDGALTEAQDLAAVLS